MNKHDKHWSVIIVGAGQAAFQVVQTLKKHGHDHKILLIGKEPYHPYQRPPLSKEFLFEEGVSDALFFRQERYYQDRDIVCMLGNSVCFVDAKNLQVFCEKGEVFSCDKLVLATGGEAFFPPIPGLYLDGVHTLRHQDDALALKKILKRRMPLVVMGGGYIGLEVAASARRLGCSVTLLEREKRLMARIATPELSAFFLTLHRHHGVQCDMGAAVSHLEGRARKLNTIVVDGQEKSATSLLLACGLRPTIPRCLQSLPVGVTGGVKVDECGRVEGYDNIFACGDIAEQKDYFEKPLRLESVQNAIYQGKKVASAILGRPAPVYEHPWFWSHQYDVMLRVVGISKGAKRIIQRGTINHKEPGKSMISFFALRGERLLAVESINMPEAFILARKHMLPEGLPVNVRALADDKTPLKKALCIND